MARKSKLTKQQLNFVHLVARSLKGEDWAAVSDQLWEWTKKMQKGMPELVEIHLTERKVRLSHDGHVVNRWC